MLHVITAMRIALVNPTPAAQAPIARVLEARDHEVLCFAQGGQALERIRTDAGVEALIADADATPISGLELCWETRLMAGRKRAIYVLLIAASDDQRTWIEALDCGADDVIGKPPLTDQLYAKLRVAERVVTLQRELIQLATRDPLTGVHNRRAFFEEATDACREADSGGCLSAVLLDIDRFKAINDHCGHDVGDDALRAVAGEAARGGAIVGRLGGDEFSVLLRGYDVSGAVEVAEDLRERLARLRIPSRDGILGLTCSLGASEFELGDTVDDLMKRSDLALYRAQSGAGG
jgi:two-component system cell cycle response regulator